MKIYNINPINFKGQREDRKTVSQLKSDNPYDLNLINQRRIFNAIDNLSEVSGEDNVEFLLDVSENLKYGTNIDLNVATFNDWRVKLDDAIQKSLSKSSYDVQQKFAPRIEKLRSNNDLTDDEKEILKLRESILYNVDYQALNDIKSKNVKNLNNNLDYFIISSDVPLSHKLYIMRRLNYFMSEDYQINEQLKDKKTQALAEIVNDIVVDTPESKIPNIKSINQKQHGMCAAISICRKLLAYEDKVNFVDMILSELDNSDNLEVYDINNLGSGKKIPLKKNLVDFDYALSKGYRIIDASALYWMHIADSAGANNESVGMYVSFDKDLFDTFHDSHFLPDIDEEISPDQDYYRALLKSKEILTDIKKEKIASKYKNQVNLEEKESGINMAKKYNTELIRVLSEISPNMSKPEIRDVKNELLKLEVKDFAAVKRIDDYNKNFVYLPNETAESKIDKIKAFLAVAMPEKDSKILNKNAVKIIGLINNIHNNNRTKEPVSYEAKQINCAKKLYSAAAAYRTQIIMRLLVQDEKDELLINFGMPDRETAIIQNMNKLLNDLEQGKLDPRIKEVLVRNFQIENNDEILAQALRENKNSIEYIMTDLLDDFYKVILSGSRKQVLIKEIETLNNMVNENDQQTIEILSKNLGIKDDKELLKSILNKYIDILNSDDCTNDEYTEIYNNIGNKSQMKDFADTMNRLNEELFVNKNPNIIPGFNLINGLSADATFQETLEAFNKIAEQFNEISKMTSVMQNALEVRTPEGIILNTVVPDEIIIKKLENNGELISERDLKILQDRFSAIDNALSEVNGETIKLRDLPKNLVTLTKHEQQILAQIERNINGWQKQTNRSLDAVYKKIKDPLSELNRSVGVKMGQKWVWPEGQSGLLDRQEVRIVEYMTGRPYYSDQNIQRSLSKIKSSPYSGISSTSVDDKKPAWHAQYIADIKPIEVRTKKGTIETREAMFHDNSWGPIEHENVWYDKSGFLRTDYSRGYGGDLGYLTDEKYLSGKLVDNILGQVGVWSAENINSKQYKRLSGRTSFDDAIKFPMINSVITPGKSPSAGSYVKMLRENRLISSVWFFNDLENLAKSMSRAEIKEIIKKTETIGENLENEYLRVERKVFGNPPFDNGISTLQDYNKLKDNDPLKILFEKIALFESYKDIPDSKIFYDADSISKLEKLRVEVKKIARKNFDYSFAKNKDIVIYGTEHSRKMLNSIIKNFANENNLKLSNNEIVKIINSMKDVKSSEFDGSLDTTSRLMAESFAKYFAKHTPEFSDKKIKINILKNDVQRYVRKSMDIKVEDLKDSAFSTTKMKMIEHWIDENFDPKSDEEFVEIYNKLRNMTTKEFNEKYSPKIKDSDLGILPLTGFDIVKKFRTVNEITQNKVFNMLYWQHLGENLKLSKMSPSYEYNKFERVLRGSYYSGGKRTFDDIYFDYYYSLFTLTLQDKLSKMRTQVFKKYGVFPAYPVLEYEDKEELEETLKNLKEDINTSFESIENYKNIEVSCSIVENLKKYLSRLKDSTALPAEKKYYIEEKVAEFLELNSDDDSIKDTIDAANNLLELDESAKAIEYKKLIDKMYQEVSFYSKTANGKTTKDYVREEIESINSKKKDFVKNIFPEKYHSKAYKIINRWLSAKMNNIENADDIFDIEFAELFDKHRIIRTPEKMLNEYLLMIAKNENNEVNLAASDKYVESLKDKLSKMEKGELKHSAKEFEMLKQEYKELAYENNIINNFKQNIESLIISADNLELEYILMNIAKDANLNIVRNEFKKSQTMLKNKEIVSIDSPKALNMLVMPMILGDNHETTMRFVDELNLNDGVAKMIIESSHTDNVKKCFEDIDNIFASISEQIKFANEQREKLGNIDNDPEYKEKLEKFRRIVKKKCKQTSYSKTAKIFSTGVDNTLKIIEEHPEGLKTAYLFLNMDNAKDAVIALARKEVENINSQLMDFQKIVDFARELKLREDSPVKPEYDAFLKVLDELDQVAIEHSKIYEELNLSTIAAL